MKRRIIDYEKLTTEVLDLLLEKFPDGIFRVPANYYLAECAFNQEQDDVAKLAY